MRRAARRRHAFFFSTSLAAHVLFVLVAFGVALIVSDTPRTDADRPLAVSLSPGEEAGGPPAPSLPVEKTVPHKERSIPFAPPAESPRGPEYPGGAAKNDRGDPRLLADYIRGVRARIDRHKRYPSTAAREGIEGTVTVSFVLDSRGILLEKEIAAGSGHAILDEAALTAVADASPFPPFPDGLGRETLLLRLPINYERR
jgi:protein TonB